MSDLKKNIGGINSCAKKETVAIIDPKSRPPFTKVACVVRSSRILTEKQSIVARVTHRKIQYQLLWHSKNFFRTLKVVAIQPE